MNIKDLLKTMIQDSDNTAMNTLSRLVTEEDINEARVAIGLPYLVEINNTSVKVSPKEYSNILRSLYISSYLRRPFSQLALTIMLETNYNTQLPQKLPPNTKIAHKVGFYKEGGYFHDCGIVYTTQKNYIICVMSENTTKEESERIISTISQVTYNFMIEKKN